MIIQKDSILNNLPLHKLDDKSLIFIDSIIHTINIVDISYTRLLSTLEKDNDNASELSMIDVWTMIDAAYRLRCLLNGPRVFKKNDTWYQLTLKRLNQTEDVRHFIQHYKER